ncbi:MAG: DUF302 domain-containing protein [Thiohalorhabdus sp.]|uniref:DUF302 domain-containing protein n=1 Tax=Thiohalorhabdus sp. TaxID=3094134 RepID=UPI00397F1FFA
MVARIIVAVALLVSAPLAGAAQGNPNFFEREIPDASVELVLSQLQNAIDEAGFTFMRVQNVDKGLEAKGFERPPYKIVFFGDREAFEKAREIDPRVTPYLPLKITLFEDDKGRVHLSVVDPAVVGRMFNPGLQEQFQDWSRQMRQILDDTAEEVEGSTLSP